MLVKLQPHSLSSLTIMPHQQNTYKIVLRNLHWDMPTGDHAVLEALACREALTLAMDLELIVSM